MPYELVPLTKAKSQIEMSNDDLVRLSKFGLGRDVIQKIYTMLDDDGDFVFRLISSSLKPPKEDQAPTRPSAVLHNLDRVKWVKSWPREQQPKWLRKWSARTCAIIAKVGKLEVLQWARANGCPWDEYNTCSAAERRGHLEVLQWVANGCPS